MFLHVVFVLSFFNGEVDSNILFTETKAYKVKFNTWTKKYGYNTSIWATPQCIFST